MNPFELFHQKPDKAPFEKWKSLGYMGGSADFYSLPEFPDLLVRKSQEFDVTKDKKKLTTAEAIEFWSVRAKALQNFGERYGIKTAKTRYFVGNDPKFKSDTPKESCPAFMAATDFISGDNLEEMREFDEKAAAEIDTMFVGLFSGMHDSYLENGYWWRDYGNTQVMYGTAPGEEEPHIYIVDMDPHMESWREFLPKTKEYVFWLDVEYIFNNMRELEKKFAHGTKQFEKARSTLSEIVASMPVPEREVAQDLRERLISRI